MKIFKNVKFRAKGKWKRETAGELRSHCTTLTFSSPKFAFFYTLILILKKRKEKKSPLFFQFSLHSFPACPPARSVLFNSSLLKSISNSPYEEISLVSENQFSFVCFLLLFFLTSEEFQKWESIWWGRLNSLMTLQ